MQTDEYNFDIVAAFTESEICGLTFAQYLVLYIYQKLDGEPAKWWSTLPADSKSGYKKVTDMLVTRYGKNEERLKNALRQHVTLELNNLKQGNKILREYVAQAKDIHFQIEPDQERILIDNFISNLASESFQDLVRSWKLDGNLNFLQVIEKAIDVPAESEVSSNPGAHEPVEPIRGSRFLLVCCHPWRMLPSTPSCYRFPTAATDFCCQYGLEVREVCRLGADNVKGS
ncbi:hypothetical protein V490_05682 [Pseudogymnoascus sp. VKM F-3557]|nr:hypothetical protein V490_05682 [Pseudogymnoascus sp. VKM F-3557]